MDMACMDFLREHFCRDKPQKGHSRLPPSPTSSASLNFRPSPLHTTLPHPQGPPRRRASVHPARSPGVAVAAGGAPMRPPPNPHLRLLQPLQLAAGRSHSAGKSEYLLVRSRTRPCVAPVRVLGTTRAASVRPRSSEGVGGQLPSMSNQYCTISKIRVLYGPGAAGEHRVCEQLSGRAGRGVVPPGARGDRGTRRTRSRRHDKIHGRQVGGGSGRVTCAPSVLVQYTC
jgi:hypothetical protein